MQTRRPDPRGYNRKMPLVIVPGPGSELYRGLGSAVLGGLLLSTFVSIFFVPALFSLTEDLKKIVRIK